MWRLSVNQMILTEVRNVEKQTICSLDFRTCTISGDQLRIWLMNSDQAGDHRVTPNADHYGLYLRAFKCDEGYRSVLNSRSDLAFLECPRDNGTFALWSYDACEKGMM